MRSARRSASLGIRTADTSGSSATESVALGSPKGRRKEATKDPRLALKSEPLTIHGQLPKLCGADIELGNFVLGAKTTQGSGFEASRLLLREIDGLPRSQRFRGEPCKCLACRRARQFAKNRSNGRSGTKPGQVTNPQDWGRRYLASNGGCAYIDLDHLELCLPEVLSAYDHVAAWHAMLRIARAALDVANSKLQEGRTIQVLVNNSDGQGNSYGSHLDFLISRRAWDNIFRRKVHYMLFLAAFQVSSIVYTGQGKVRSEGGSTNAAFQLSARADFFERLVGTQTTHNRPIVNSRDEALCGSNQDESDGAAAMARLHVIFFDNTLCHISSLLKVGVMQIMLSMIEAGEVDTALLLDDPLDALKKWSQDPTLGAAASLATGKTVSALELQFQFFARAKAFVEKGGCDEVVPRVREILNLWEDTLLKLESGDFESLALRLDWVLKLTVLQQVIDKNPSLSWDSPEVKHLDHLYSSLDPAEGLYWVYEKSGLVERVVSDEEIERFTKEPPDDTRAWTRAMLLRSVPEAVDEVDWDAVRLKTGSKRYRTTYRSLELDNPLAFTKADSAGCFENWTTIEQLLDSLASANRPENLKGA